MAKSEGREDLGVYGRIILKLIFKKWNEDLGPDLSGSEYGQLASSCEGGNEL
jgi:hypothetical protein